MGDFITLSNTAYNALEKMIADFVVDYGDVFKKFYPGFKGMKKTYKFGILLGHHGNAIYLFTSEHKLSGKNIMSFKMWVEKAQEANASAETNDNRLTQILNQLDRFEKELLTKGGKRNRDLTEKDTSEKVSGILSLLAYQTYYLWEMGEKTLMRKVAQFGGLRKGSILDITIPPIKPFLGGTLSGETIVDEGENNVIIYTSEKKKFNYTSFMFRVEPGAERLEILIGQMTSPHREKKHLTTKNVLLEFVPRNEKPQTAEYFKADLNSLHSAKDIIKLLHDESLNTLSSPTESIILDKKALASWHIVREEELNAEIPHNIIGIYRAYFEKNPLEVGTKVIENKLSIEQSSFSNEIVATYEQEEKSYRGKVNFVNGVQTLTVLLDGPFMKFKNAKNQTEEKKVGNEPIYCALEIPFKRDEKEADTYTGTITRIVNGAPSSQLVLVTKSTFRTKDESQSSIIESFFINYAERSAAIPPQRSKIRRIQDLAEANVEGAFKNSGV